MPRTPNSSRKSSDSKTNQVSDILWEGFQPIQQQPPRPTPEFEKKFDFPFGTTRSGSIPKFHFHENGMVSRKPYRFFKEKSLRDPKDQCCDASESSSEHPMQSRNKSHKT